MQSLQDLQAAMLPFTVCQKKSPALHTKVSVSFKYFLEWAKAPTLTDALTPGRITYEDRYSIQTCFCVSLTPSLLYKLILKPSIIY